MLLESCRIKSHGWLYHDVGSNLVCDLASLAGSRGVEIKYRLSPVATYLSNSLLESVVFHVICASNNAGTGFFERFRFAFDIVSRVCACCQQEVVHNLLACLSGWSLHKTRLRNVKLHGLGWTHVTEIIILVAFIEEIAGSSAFLCRSVRFVIWRE